MKYLLFILFIFVSLNAVSQLDSGYYTMNPTDVELSFNDSVNISDYLSKHGIDSIKMSDFDLKQISIYVSKIKNTLTIGVSVGITSFVVFTFVSGIPAVITYSTYSMCLVYIYIRKRINSNKINKIIDSYKFQNGQ